MPDSLPPPDPEAQRLQALCDYGVLDSGADPASDEITQLAARLFAAPIAFVSLIDRDRQWFKSRVGFDRPETPRAIAFCDHAIRGREVMVVADTRLDPRFAANPVVSGAAGIRFYAGAPLLTPSGKALGTLCVLDREPRDFGPEQCATLAVLARQVMAQLELRRQHGLLSDTVHALQASETRMALVLKGANDGFWDWDLVGGERFHSERGWRMLGYADAPPPYDDQLWERLVHPDDLRLAGRRFGDAIKSRAEHFSIELRLRHRDGHAVPVLTRGFIVRDANGRALRVAGTNTDLSERRRAERERQEVQDRFEMLFAHGMDGMLQTLPEGPVLAANPAACAMLGLSEAELIRRGRHGLLDVADPRLQPLLDERARKGCARGELRMFRADGELFEVEVSSSLYRDRDGRQLASVMFRDITERRTWARRLEESLDLLDNLSRRVPGVIYQFRRHPDGRSCFPFASDGIDAIFELGADAVMHDASPVFARLHPDDAAAVNEAIEVSATTLQPWRQEFRMLLPEQGERWRQGEALPERLADGSVLWHGFISDVTERKRIEARTHRLAHFDALTGLPNRRLLLERIEHALGSAQRSGQMGALLFIDLDNFKDINDARGHAVGDVMLQQVARRLEALLRGEDSVARLGGDEFVVLVGNLGADAEGAARSAMAVVEKLRQLLDSPYEIDGHLYSSSGSIGITLFPKGGERVDDLLREADTAMYRAKAAGRNRIAFFEAAMQSEVEQRLALEQDLKEAIATGQLQAHVQPQFDAGGTEVGGELLLRWQHPVRGNVAPTQFIPVAEESGLILALGEFVIRQACAALAGMHRSGARLPLSVNVSPRQFHQDGFVDGVRRVLAETGADASGLIFEVTEGLLIDDWEATLARISELVALGIRFSIDDFGTGYSSLAYLTRLPLYELKIDRSFVAGTPGDANGTAIVEAIVSVARHLRLRVVAEGVETRAQADFLAGIGCDCLQGYLFARPLPLAAWLAQRARLALA